MYCSLSLLSQLSQINTCVLLLYISSRISANAEKAANYDLCHPRVNDEYESDTTFFCFFVSGLD